MATGLCAGSYSVIATDNYGQTDTAYVTIPTSNGPTASFTSNATNGYFILNSNNQLCFEDNSLNASAWQWSFSNQPNSNQENPCIAITEADTGNFCANLIVTDNAGCLDTSSVCYVIENEFYSAPNVFTPNGDGINDVFEISVHGMKNVKCFIYDRWGVQVYNWNSLNGFWNGKTADGRSVSNGTYYYVLELTDDVNHIYNASGFVMLIR